MNPDILFLAGLVFLGLTFPAVVAGFSSSNQTFRPAIVLSVIGVVLLTLAMVGGHRTYTLADVPRIALELFR